MFTYICDHYASMRLKIYRNTEQNIFNEHVVNITRLCKKNMKYLRILLRDLKKPKTMQPHLSKVCT